MNIWKDHFNDTRRLGSEDPQMNIARTKGGKSITQELWSTTVDDIVKLCHIHPESEVMELCCGNGVLIGPVASLCKKAIGVDFSVPLLAELNAAYGDRIETHLADALEFEWENESLDVVMVYFSIQHFSERNALRLIEQAFCWLKDGGMLFIGDVPDDSKKWAYMNKPEYRRDYLIRLKENRPMIGEWFHKEFFLALNNYDPMMTVKVMDQPPHHFNSDTRFDVVIQKKNAE